MDPYHQDGDDEIGATVGDGDVVEAGCFSAGGSLMGNAEGKWGHCILYSHLRCLRAYAKPAIEIARWFNLTHNRRGRFWADRFKSVLLEDEKAMFDCLLYVELNPIRAGIVPRPEEFDGSSIYYREMKDDKWMVPLVDIAGREKRSGSHARQ